MHFLVDGYNLMFALGLAGRYSGPRSLQKSRDDLLAWLHAAHGPSVGQVTVVFDGRSNSGAGDSHESGAGPIVRFSAGHPADDLIEEIIRQCADPKKLTVISSDHRIQTAAKRRKCLAWGCSAYLDWALTEGHPPPQPRGSPQKPDSPSAQETEQWLLEFGDLTSNSELKQFNQPFDDFHKTN